MSGIVPGRKKENTGGVIGAARDFVVEGMPEKIRNLPLMPTVLLKLLEAFRGETATPADIEKIISCDEVLAAKLLQLANSSYYGNRGAVRTLSRAVVTMGLQEVKTVCLCCLLHRQFGDGSDTASERERLWKHSLTVAHLTGHIAEARPWITRDEAYILGLLHDIGRMVMLVHFREYYGMIREAAESRNIPDWLVEREHGFSHTKLGKWVALRWNLPEVYRMVIEHHHAPEESPAHLQPVKMVRLADLMAWSILCPWMLETEETELLCRALRIPKDEWTRHLERVPDVQREVDELWDRMK